MHPADEFEAFRALVDSGTCEADVAARFGVTEAVVSKRLKLAPWIELLIGCYFFLAIIYCFSNHNYFTAPFLIERTRLRPTCVVSKTADVLVGNAN